MDPSGTMRTLLWGDERQFLQLVRLLLADSQPQASCPDTAPALNLEAHRRAWNALRYLSIEKTIGWTAIELQHPISGSNAGALRVALGFDAKDFRLHPEVCGGWEAGRANLLRPADHPQAHKPQKVIVGNLFHSGHIIAKEIGEA